VVIQIEEKVATLSTEFQRIGEPDTEEATKIGGIRKKRIDISLRYDRIVTNIIMKSGARDLAL